jgi:hypothetical protein
MALPANPLRFPFGQVAVKIETTAGTWSAPTGTECMVAEQLVITPEVEFVPQNPVQTTNLNLPGTTGLQKGKISFKCWMNGSSAAGTAPDWGDALKACGFGETVVAVTSVTYKRTSAYSTTTGWATASLAAYVDGMLFSMSGCVGNVTMEMVPGRAVLLSFDFEGLWRAPTTGAFLTPTVSSAAAVACGAASTFMDATACRIRKLTWKSGNIIFPRLDLGTSGGLIANLISDSKMVADYEVEAYLSSDFDLWGKYLAQTLGVVKFPTTSVMGSSAGNKWAIATNKCYITSLTHANSEGIMTISGELLVGAAAGDNTEGADWSLAWT